MLMLGSALLISAPVGASLIITAGNGFLNSPSLTNTLEINLTNTGPASLSLGGFSFEIEVTDPDITSALATTAMVAPYVFAGNSLYGPIISTSVPGEILDVLDLWSGVGGGATIAAGATMGLGHVFFDVSAGDSSGLVPVTLSPFPATTLSDPEDRNVSVDELANGSITIAGSAVPEPSALTLVLLGLVALVRTRKRFSR
jgi:PEP-CTERM motif-containing protein